MENMYLSTAEAENGFYPTPEKLADKLLVGIDWEAIRTVLEPSAGSGNLVDAVLYKLLVHSNSCYKEGEVTIDCIEFDPHLRSIIKYEYGGEHESELRDELDSLHEKERYNYDTRSIGGLTSHEKMRKHILDQEIRKRCAALVHVVHDDFLTFDSRKHYDLIVMNPPFSDGDAHLLKAIQMQQKHGGQLRCILNAETILNPCTNRRKLLKSKLDEIKAKIDFVDGAFSKAERRTDVRVAVISSSIPAPSIQSDIYERLRKAASIDDGPVTDVTDMTVTDFLSQIVSRYNVESDAGIALIQEYAAMRPYIAAEFEHGSREPYTTLTLCVGDTSHNFCGDVPNSNKYLRLVRAKYWRALFSNKEFVGKLTSNLREKYSNMVDSLSDYDFTLFNIQQIGMDMNAEINTGIQDTIVSLFDKLTQKYAWYPEIEKNVHYYNGWKTNKAHKINSKVIVPANGLFSSYSWSKPFDVGEAESLLGDIEKVFDYLDGDMTSNVNLRGVLNAACDIGQTRSIACKYFDVTLYKKGTAHIKFRNQELVDRFNIYCCRKKNWLPPTYGKKSYSNLTQEERTSVDGFNGSGEDGSGKESYERVCAKSAYYLSEPQQKVPMLTA